MTFDIEDNNGFDGSYSDGYEREDFLLYLALPLRVLMSLAIITSASIVLQIIKKSKITFNLHLFFIANLMIADIGVAVIHNGAAILNMILTISNSMRKGMDCRIIAVTGFPTAANVIVLAALCFDHLYNVTAPNHYRKNMTKRKGYVIVSGIWLVSLLFGFFNFLDTHLSCTKTKNVVCDDPLIKNYLLVLPLFLSAMFVMSTIINFKCLEVEITTRNDSNNNGVTEAGALGALKETEKKLTILFILSVTSTMFGIFHLISVFIQLQTGIALFKAVWFTLIFPFVYSFSIFFHSVLFGCVLLVFY